MLPHDEPSPGSHGVAERAQQAYEQLIAAGVQATPVKDEGWGPFTYFTDPDGNKWAVQELPNYN
ncbi:VOC family protein [Nocardia wallacei]|uniref:VOC family protein n=1 Tax=Nocardia wallacei TaxID=480035 RepID=UPI00313CD9EE